jgi:hypothetical protein
MKKIKKNNAAVFMLINLVLILNVQYCFCNPFSSLPSFSEKQQYSESTTEHPNPNSAEATIIDEDETNEGEMHPSRVNIGFSNYQSCISASYKTLKLSVVSPYFARAIKPPMYLLVSAFRI